MPNQLEAVDPRGRKIICTAERWASHIVSFHPAMIGDEKEVIAAIEDPEFGIYGDADFANRQVYYRRTRGKLRYTKVVVEFNEAGEGKVITAFRTDSPKAGEKLVWPISKD